nr:hypothetical protein [Tanacetum cinerariifolium]
GRADEKRKTKVADAGEPSHPAKKLRDDYGAPGGPTVGEIDLLAFIRTADPTKVRFGERQRDKDEPKFFETTVGRVVPLLPVAPDRSSGELEASVDKIFDEGESG